MFFSPLRACMGLVPPFSSLGILIVLTQRATHSANIHWVFGPFIPSITPGNAWLTVSRSQPLLSVSRSQPSHSTPGSVTVECSTTPACREHRVKLMHVLPGPTYTYSYSLLLSGCHANGKFSVSTRVPLSKNLSRHIQCCSQWAPFIDTITLSEYLGQFALSEHHVTVLREHHSYSNSQWVSQPKKKKKIALREHPDSNSQWVSQSNYPQ